MVRDCRKPKRPGRLIRLRAAWRATISDTCNPWPRRVRRYDGDSLSETHAQLFAYGAAQVVAGALAVLTLGRYTSDLTAFVMFLADEYFDPTDEVTP